MLASVVDPRTKYLNGFPEEDKVLIWNELRARMVKEETLYLENKQAVINCPDEGNDEEDDASLSRLRDDRVFDAVVPESCPLRDLFQGIDAPDNFNQLEEGVPAANDAVAIAQRVQVEYSAYRAEPAMPLLNSTNKFTEPMEWWQRNQHRFPIISRLARRWLCIPATSAPSERVFSAAGLAIASDRARLSGEVAAAQIFLHDIYPALRRRQMLKRARDDED